jgi:hypothetical protein
VLSVFSLGVMAWLSTKVRNGSKNASRVGTWVEVAGLGKKSSTKLIDDGRAVRPAQDISNSTESKSMPTWKASAYVRLVYIHEMFFSSHLEQTGCCLSQPRLAFTQPLQLFCREADVGSGADFSVMPVFVFLLCKSYCCLGTRLLWSLVKTGAGRRSLRMTVSLAPRHNSAPPATPPRSAISPHKWYQTKCACTAGYKGRNNT